MLVFRGADLLASVYTTSAMPVYFDPHFCVLPSRISYAVWELFVSFRLIYMDTLQDVGLLNDVKFLTSMFGPKITQDMT
jgi:hypothetical protein